MYDDLISKLYVNATKNDVCCDGTYNGNIQHITLNGLSSKIWINLSYELKREKPHNQCQNGEGRIVELSGKQARIDTKRLCEDEVINSDTSSRKSIDGYEFE